MPDNYSKLRLAIPPFDAEDVIHGVDVVMDELRSMAVTFNEVSQIMSRIGSRPVFTACLEIQADSLKTLETVCRPPCDLYMYKVKPYRGKGDYEGCWDSDGDTLALDNSRFQSVTWESEPLEVTISIIPNKKKYKH